MPRRAADGKLNTIAKDIGVQPMPVNGNCELVGDPVRKLDRMCADELLLRRCQQRPANT